MSQSSGSNSSPPAVECHVCHYYFRRALNTLLHARVSIKAQFLLALVVVGAAVQSLGVLPESVFSDKNNPVNQYLVKLSWMWTLTFLIPTVLITAVDSSSMWEAAVGHYGRVSVGHGMWFGVTSLIEVLDNTVGECTKGSISTARVCLREGHQWTGFDISGHVFLLSYCIFIITEEAASLRPEVWRAVGAAAPPRRTWLGSINCRVGSLIAGGLELYALALILVWIVMITATSFYFHTFLEKLVGCVVAVAIWKLTYEFVYGRYDYLPRHPRGSGRGSGRGIMRREASRRQGEESASRRVRFTAGDSPSGLQRSSLKQTS